MVALPAAVGIGRSVYTAILQFIEAGIRITKAEAGLIAPAIFLSYLMGALGASWHALPRRRRTWLVVMLGFSSLTTERGEKWANISITIANSPRKKQRR